MLVKEEYLMPNENQQKDITNDIKNHLIKLLIGLRSSLPADQQSQLDPMIDAMQDPRTLLPENANLLRSQISILLALICAAPDGGLPQLMTESNKNLILAFSKQNEEKLKALNEKNTPTSKPQKSGH